MSAVVSKEIKFQQIRKWFSSCIRFCNMPSDNLHSGGAMLFTQSGFSAALTQPLMCCDSRCCWEICLCRALLKLYYRVSFRPSHGQIISLLSCSVWPDSHLCFIAGHAVSMKRPKASEMMRNPWLGPGLMYVYGFCHKNGAFKSLTGDCMCCLSDRK